MNKGVNEPGFVSKSKESSYEKLPLTWSISLKKTYSKDSFKS